MGTSPEKPKKEPMSVRFLFIMAGVIWGLVLGPDIGLAVAKFMGGLNWPFIAGTREWPEWVDWVIIASGVITGLAIFFTALIIGRNIGDRLEYSHDVRLSSGGAIPWAIIAVGVAMGGITVLTIEGRQQAVVVYVQDQKSALVRLEAFANQVRVEEEALALYRQDPARAALFLTEYSIGLANSTVASYWDLGDRLWVRFNNLF